MNFFISFSHKVDVHVSNATAIEIICELHSTCTTTLEIVGTDKSGMTKIACSCDFKVDVLIYTINNTYDPGNDEGGATGWSPFIARALRGVVQETTIST